MGNSFSEIIKAWHEDKLLFQYKLETFTLPYKESDHYKNQCKIKFMKKLKKYF